MRILAGYSQIRANAYDFANILPGIFERLLQICNICGLVNSPSFTDDSPCDYFCLFAGICRLCAAAYLNFSAQPWNASSAQCWIRTTERWETCLCVFFCDEWVSSSKYVCNMRWSGIGIEIVEVAVIVTIWHIKWNHWYLSEYDLANTLHPHTRQ